MRKRPTKRRPKKAPPPATPPRPPRPGMMHTDKSPEEVIAIFHRIIDESPTIAVEGIYCRAYGVDKPDGTGVELFMRAIDPRDQARLDRLMQEGPPPPAASALLRRLGRLS